MTAARADAVGAGQIDLSGGLRYHSLELPRGGRFQLQQACSITCRADFGSATRPYTGDVLRISELSGTHALGLTVQNANVTSHQPNFRQPAFWVQTDEPRTWADLGRVGEADSIRALAVHEGSLYASTYEGSEDAVGRVMRYAAEGSWEDCGLPTRANAVSSLAVFRGQLFAGTARFHGRGTAMAESPNRTPGGSVYRYDGGNGWEECGRLPGEDGVAALAVFSDDLYAIPKNGEGIYVMETSSWRRIEGPGRRLISLGVALDRLFGTGNEGGGVVPWLGTEGGGVFEYDAGGRAWRSWGLQPDTTQVYSLAEYRRRIYVSTWPGGVVYTPEAGRWRSCGRLGSELEAMGMIVYNGRLYAGALPSAAVYRYEGGTTWVSTGHVDDTADQRYRRAWGMAVFRGALHCGSTPQGHVRALHDGWNVTYDADPGPGVHHLAGVIDGSRMVLYVDGVRVSDRATAAASDAVGMRPVLGLEAVLTTDFPGAVSDVRVYDRALSDREIAALGRRA